MQSHIDLISSTAQTCFNQPGLSQHGQSLLTNKSSIQTNPNQIQNNSNLH